MPAIRGFMPKPTTAQSGICEEHCKTAESKGMPTTLKEYVSYKSNKVHT